MTVVLEEASLMMGTVLSMKPGSVLNFNTCNGKVHKDNECLQASATL